jgi:hypothetical protein
MAATSGAEHACSAQILKKLCVLAEQVYTSNEGKINASSPSVS